MSICPNRLNGIATHMGKPDQLECRRRQLSFGIFMNIPQDIRFTLAAGAGTPSPQRFQRNETFIPVIPFDGQFLANQLNVQWSYQRFFRRRSKAARVSGLT